MSSYTPIRDRVKQRKQQERKAKAVTFSDFLIDWKRNKMIMIGLGGSAFFTALMGLFIGLNPKLDAQGTLILFGGSKEFGAIFLGILFGVAYMIAFPILGEWGTYYWHRKAALRDEGNNTQALIAYTTMVLAAAFTITTALAASYILASLLHTFEVFNAIPEWAQKWTITIIPIALAVHAGMNIWYDHVSKYAEERREMERGLQQTEMEAENRIRQARIDAKERAAKAMAEEYERISSEEAVTSGVSLAHAAWSRDKAVMEGDDDQDGIPNLIDSDPNSPPLPTGDMDRFSELLRRANDLSREGTEMIKDMEDAEPEERGNHRSPAYVPRNFTAPVPRKK